MINFSPSIVVSPGNIRNTTMNAIMGIMNKSDVVKASVLLSPEVIIEIDTAEKKICLETNKKKSAIWKFSTHVENYLWHNPVQDITDQVLQSCRKTFLGIK